MKKSGVCTGNVNDNTSWDVAQECATYNGRQAVIPEPKTLALCQAVIVVKQKVLAISQGDRKDFCYACAI